MVDNLDMAAIHFNHHKNSFSSDPAHSKPVKYKVSGVCESISDSIGYASCLYATNGVVCTAKVDGDVGHWICKNSHNTNTCGARYNLSMSMDGLRVSFFHDALVPWIGDPEGKLMIEDVDARIETVRQSFLERTVTFVVLLKRFASSSSYKCSNQYNVDFSCVSITHITRSSSSSSFSSLSHSSSSSSSSPHSSSMPLTSQ